MNPAGAFLQILFLVVAVGIGFTYLHPTFTEIQSIQDDIQYYKDEIAKVDSVNEQLRQLVSQLEAIPRDDRQALFTYMPDEIDALSVMKDISLIGEASELQIATIAMSDGSTENYLEKVEGKVSPEVTSFQVDANGTYAELKQFLALLEQNSYQLMVSSLLITPENDEEVTSEDVLVSMTLTAFSLPDSVGAVIK